MLLFSLFLWPSGSLSGGKGVWDELGYGFLVQTVFVCYCFEAKCSLTACVRLRSCSQSQVSLEMSLPGTGECGLAMAAIALPHIHSLQYCQQEIIFLIILPITSKHSVFENKNPQVLRDSLEDFFVQKIWNPKLAHIAHGMLWKGNESSVVQPGITPLFMNSDLKAYLHQVASQHYLIKYKLKGIRVWLSRKCLSEASAFSKAFPNLSCW